MKKLKEVIKEIEKVKNTMNRGGKESKGDHAKNYFIDEIIGWVKNDKENEKSINKNASSFNIEKR